MVRRKPIAALGAALLAAVAVDVGLSVTVLADGILLGRPLPPFRSAPLPEQVDWATRLGGEEAALLGRFDAELGWTWRRGAAVGGRHVNALGARGERETPPRPPEGRTRILCFGDSFVFGDKVEDGETIPEFLERSEPSFEVVNFGVSGYGTDQSLLRYRRVGRDLGARVVVIGLLLENVGRNVNRYRPLWTPTTGIPAGKPRFVLAGEGLELLPQPFGTAEQLRRALLEDTAIERAAEGEHWYECPPVPTGRVSSLARVAAGWFAYRARSPERLWRDPEGEAFRVTVRILEAFHREALADGAELAPVLVLPSSVEVELLLEGEPPYWSGLLEELARRGVPAVDCTGPLAEDERGRRARGEGSAFNGYHPSPAGNEAVARELAAWLRPRVGPAPLESGE